MNDLSQPHASVVLLLNAASEDLLRLRNFLANDSIQLYVVSAEELERLSQSDARVDCIMVYFTGNSAQLDDIALARQCFEYTPVIAYGSSWQVSTVVQAMKLGASEVCESRENPGELRTTLDRCLSAEANKQARFSELIPKAVLAKLNSEEARILQLLVQGRTTKEVGATLDVSIRTVHYRKKELLRKLGVQNRSEAIELIRLSAHNFFNYGPDLQAL